METAAAILVGLGLLLNLVFRYGTARLLLAGSRRIEGASPPVSILKPLKGADPDLADNLRGFFALDYPEYEIIFAVAEPTDPAVTIARQVLAEYPHRSACLVIDDHKIGGNPKVNNLAVAARHARYEVLLISDSNIRVRPGYLRDMVYHLCRANTGLVTSLFTAAGGRSLGERLESLHLHTFVVGGVGGAMLAGGAAAVGKSMLLRRADLQAIGGWAFLGRYLAEDQVCAEEIRALGKDVRVAGEVIENVLGPMTLGAFFARHTRWALLRKRLLGAAYIGEPFFNPLVLALACLAVAPSAFTLCIAGFAWPARVLLDRSAERALSVKRPFIEYFWLSPLREALIVGAWGTALFRRTVLWRGLRYAVGPRTRTFVVETLAQDTPSRSATSALNDDDALILPLLPNPTAMNTSPVSIGASPPLALPGAAGRNMSKQTRRRKRQNTSTAATVNGK